MQIIKFFAVADKVNNVTDVILSLEEVGLNIITWFSNNKMKLNPDKCYLLNTKEQITLKIGNSHIKFFCANNY